jgi:glycosyltransferase involved in cell wall biosynthesis
MPHYRVAFFNLLKTRLSEHGVELKVYYGLPTGRTRLRGDAKPLDWATQVRVRSLSLGSRDLYWEDCVVRASEADLVILEASLGILSNLPVLLLRKLLQKTVALWGHGPNAKSTSTGGALRRLRSSLARQADWWFVYTDRGIELLRAQGFPSSRVTSVQNAIDTTHLVRVAEQTSLDQVQAVKVSLGLSGSHTALFVGAMRPGKRVDYALETCEVVRSRVPDFEAIFVGAGETQGLVEVAAARHDWIHYCGHVSDDTKIPLFQLAKVMLMPGYIGLGILDSFALEVPMVTLAGTQHSVEFAYMVPGQNGVVVEDSGGINAYADAICRVLLDEEFREHLRAGCRLAREKYTVENMAQRYAEGILQAMALRSRR